MLSVLAIAMTPPFRDLVLCQHPLDHPLLWLFTVLYLSTWQEKSYFDICLLVQSFPNKWATVQNVTIILCGRQRIDGSDTSPETIRLGLKWVQCNDTRYMCIGNLFSPNNLRCNAERKPPGVVSIDVTAGQYPHPILTWAPGNAALYLLLPCVQCEV